MIDLLTAFIVCSVMLSAGILIGVMIGRKLGFAEAERLVRIKLGWLKGK